MSALTKKERDGLDDVFLSIHSDSDKYQRFKELSALIISHKTSLDVQRLLERAKVGLKEVKISHFLADIQKKKKNLSK